MDAGLQFAHNGCQYTLSCFLKKARVHSISSNRDLIGFFEEEKKVFLVAMAWFPIEIHKARSPLGKVWQSCKVSHKPKDRSKYNSRPFSFPFLPPSHFEPQFSLFFISSPAFGQIPSTLSSLPLPPNGTCLFFKKMKVLGCLESALNPRFKRWDGHHDDHLV